jgi:hypothetical protein
MLGTCPKASIYNEHVLSKTKKELEKANKLGAKVTKALAKYSGSALAVEKEIMELQGIVRSFQARLGRNEALPETIPELLELIVDVEKEFDEAVKEGTQKQATVFMRDEKGWPMVSTHMILGNIKANLEVMLSTEDRSIVKTKVAAGGCGALDLKAVDEFMRPDRDIARDSEGNPAYCERAIHFDVMGKRKTAIAVSEVLPVDTEMGTVLRVRKGSPFTFEALKVLLDLGKNQGLGSWRGSGNKGAFLYQLEELPGYEEDLPPGWL